MAMLQLAPLIRKFRVKVERDEVPLETSVKTLAYASELVAFKLKCLLPNPREESVQEDAVETGLDQVSATLVPVMELWEISQAVRSLSRVFLSSDKKHPRGATMIVGTPEVRIVSIDPCEIAEAMRLVVARSGPKQRTLTVPKFSFVAHLRSFWSEVRRLTQQGVVLRFSRFLGNTKAEAILNFLAFLELIKRRRVFARQREAFGDIVFSTTREKVIEDEEVPNQ